MPKRKSVGQMDLEACGFDVHRIYGRYYFIASKGGYKYRFIRQQKNCWHAFWWGVNATGSGHFPLRAINGGGLGDVLDTDRSVKRYEQLERDMPAEDSPRWVPVEDKV